MKNTSENTNNNKGQQWKWKLKTNESNAIQAVRIAKMSHTSLYFKCNVYGKSPLEAENTMLTHKKNEKKRQQLHRPIRSQNDLARVLNVTLSLFERKKLKQQTLTYSLKKMEIRDQFSLEAKAHTRHYDKHF